MKILSEELKKFTKPTHLVDFTLGQDSFGNPIFASASETVETVDGWLQAGENVVYRVQYGLGEYAYATTTDHHVSEYVMMALFVTTSMFGPNGVYRLEAKWSITDEAPDALPTIYSVIPMENDYNPYAIASIFDEGLSYEVDDVVMYEGLRYRCTTAVSTPGEFNPNNWTQENVQTAMENAGVKVTMRVYDED